MARTYLQLVNDVLVRLREPSVATVNQTAYSTMVGALVNDSKREVEDAWQWSHLLDYLTFTSVVGLSSYETNTMLTRYAAPPISAPAGAADRTRLWLDDIESTPLLINVTKNFESRLRYEPSFTDQVTKQQVLNNSPQGQNIPSVWQVAQSTFYNQAGLWNKVILLYGLPDKEYTFQLFIVNPQADLVNDTDVMKIPFAPVVQKAYLYCLYERGEELGETLPLTVDKVEQTTANAIAHDQQVTQQYLSLTIPYGANY